MDWWSLDVFQLTVFVPEAPIGADIAFVMGLPVFVKRRKIEYLDVVFLGPLTGIEEIANRVLI